MIYVLKDQSDFLFNVIFTLVWSSKLYIYYYKLADVSLENVDFFFFIKPWTRLTRIVRIFFVHIHNFTNMQDKALIVLNVPGHRNTNQV